MHARAARQIWDDFQKREGLSDFEKQVATFISYQGYKAAQFILNQSACLFYGKKATNPDAPAFVNQDYPIFKKNINKRKHLAFQNINYPDLVYIHQPRVFDCADTAMLMLLCYQHYHCKVNGYNLFKHTLQKLEHKFVSRRLHYFFGRMNSEFKKLSDGLMFMKANGDINVEEFTYYLFRFGPFIASTKEIGGHVVVVKGIVDKQVIVHDSWSGPNLTYSFEEFKKIWDRRMIVYTLGYSKSEELDARKYRQKL